MKHLYYCCALILGVCFAVSYPVQAAYPSLSTQYSSHIKHSAYPKLAGVTFITDSDANRFKFDSADVRTQCMALGFAYLTDNCESGTAKALCSSVLTNQTGAEKYTSGCCNRKYYLYEDSNKCSNNNTIETCTTSSGKTYYHCGCNRSLYPFSGDSDCPHSNVANMINKCTTTDANNVSVTYYATCCPASYQETCTGSHLVGNGSACYRKEGESLVAKYESCSCSAHYDTICTGGGMIDPSDYCSLNGKKFTKDTNCEGLCQQTSQTNVDAEFYNKVWHCLYKEDGATIKTPELEKHLCTKNGNDYYYQTCESQGYQKSEADCFNKDIILRCPQDTSKVWCLDSKYCTGYDVVIDDANYMQKARVEMCPSTDQGYRYRYIEPDCNSCWENGVYNKTKCENKDTSAKGDDNHCCRLGYVMNNSGVCVKNTCNKTQYPYSQHPLTDIGEVETCYEGNPAASTDISLMYDPYYGYASCKSDFSQGEMWKQADDNPRMCVCDRQISGKELPYDNADYAEDTRFNKGRYGNYISCTDNNDSYYGYTACSISHSSVNNNPGLCVRAGPVGYTTTYGYLSSDYVTSLHLRPMLADAGYTLSVDCISKYKHYQAVDGTQLGDESVAAMLVEGCNYGNEAQCNTCYSVSNLANNKKNGLFTVHNDFRVKVNYFYYVYASGYNKAYYMEKCPTSTDMDYNYMSTMPRGNRGYCYKYCKLSNLQKCYMGDILVDDNNNNYKLGIVIFYWNNRVRIQSYKGGSASSQTWEQAVDLGNTFYPGKSDGYDYYKNHEKLGEGKWSIPSRSNWQNIGWGNGFKIPATMSSEGIGGPIYGAGWLKDSVSSDTAYYHTGNEVLVGNKTDRRSAVSFVDLYY